MSLRRRATQGVVWLILKDGGNTLVSFIVFTLLARLLSVEAFGLIAAAMIAVSIFQLVVDQGFAAAIIQRKDVEKEHLDSAFWVSVFIGAVLCLLLLATAWPIAAVLTGQKPELIPTLTAVLQWLSLGFIAMAMQSVPQALLQRDLEFKPLAIRAMLSNLAGGAIGVGMALGGLGVWSLVGQLLSAKIVGVVLLWRITDWRPALRFSWRHLREIFGFSLKILGFKLVSFAGQRADQVLISAALGPVSLGFYAIASRLSGLLFRVTSRSLGAVAFPAFSRIQSDSERFNDALYAVNEYAALIATPVFLGALLTAPELIAVVFGEKWAASAEVLRWLALLGLLECLLQTASSVVLARGRAGLRFAMALASVVANVTVFSIVIWAGGDMVDVALAAVIRAYAFLPGWLVVLRSVTGASLRRLGAGVAGPLAGSGAMALAVLGMRWLLDHTVAPPIGEAVYRLVVMAAIGALVYAVAIHLIRPRLIRGLLEVLPLRRSASPSEPKGSHSAALTESGTN